MPPYLWNRVLRLAGFLPLFTLSAGSAAIAQRVEAELPTRDSPSAEGRASPVVVTEAAEPPSPERLERLIENLGSASRGVRESAEAELFRCGRHAVRALDEATRGADSDAAARAGVILRRLLDQFVFLLDATGDPIPQAECVLRLKGERTVRIESDAEGFLPIAGTSDDLRSAQMEVSHTDYGRAPASFDDRDGLRFWQVALVRRDAPAYERALRGVVTGEDGEPVAGAAVACTEIRTAGEGLVNAGSASSVLTDEEGRFAIYTADRNARKRRGDLIPPGSWFTLRIDPPEGSGLFPHVGRHPNAKEAAIRLERPDVTYELEFEDPNGGLLSTPEAIQRVSVTYRKELRSAQLLLGSGLEVSRRAALVPGRYEARFGDVEYVAVEVTRESPKTLRFRLPPPITYEGRVVDGATGAPLAGAFVAGWSGSARANLALLDDGDWRALEALPSEPGVSEPAVTIVRAHYHVLALARTAADGRFEVLQKPGPKFYGLLAFARDRIPVQRRLYRVEPTADRRGVAGDLPLFPAARVFVTPVSPAERVSVMPRWIIQPGVEQPKWVKRLRSLEDGSDMDLAYDHWLERDVRQPVFVPAGVRLRLLLDVPYSDAWCPAKIPEGVLLEVGGEKDLGAVTFGRSLPATVLVVDENGKPVEGVPVRRKHEDEGGWCVAHNTDSKGIARFFVHPDSRGRFRVSDVPRESGEAEAANLQVSFEVGSEEPPALPYRIVLTARQIEAILGPRGKPSR